MDEPKEHLRWYWCLDHEAAETEDSACPPSRRWGPYATRAEAEHWKERVAARNDEWEAADEAWEDGDRKAE